MVFRNLCYTSNFNTVHGESTDQGVAFCHNQNVLAVSNGPPQHTKDLVYACWKALIGTTLSLEKPGGTVSKSFIEISSVCLFVCFCDGIHTSRIWVRMDFLPSLCEILISSIPPWQIRNKVVPQVSSKNAERAILKKQDYNYVCREHIIK